MCMYVHVCVRMCMYMHGCACRCMHISKYACTCVHMRAHAYTFMHMYECAYMCMHMHACACTSCTCMHIRQHCNVRTGTYIGTYRHITLRRFLRTCTYRYVPIRTLCTYWYVPVRTSTYRACMVVVCTYRYVPVRTSTYKLYACTCMHICMHINACACTYMHTYYIAKLQFSAVLKLQLTAVSAENCSLKLQFSAVFVYVVQNV